MSKDISLKEITKEIKPVNKEWEAKARERTAQLVMPLRALGMLHEISERLCGIQKTLKPKIDRKAVLIMAADHGVVAEGISAFPQEVTGEMVRTFLRGGAGINAICRHVGAEVWVVDMGMMADLKPGFEIHNDRFLNRKVAPGTSNFTTGPAMSREAAEKSVMNGFRLAAERFQDGVDILGTGDMGIGNTTPSAAIGTVIIDTPVESMVGRGTGVDDAGLRRKHDVVQRGIQANLPDPADGLDVLSKIGGFEIGGIAGCILAGAFYSRAVIIDGFISTAGALVAHAICPHVSGYLFAGHCSEEAGHRNMLAYLKLKPILDLGMRLGEGTGGALAMGIMEGALRVFNEVSTFEEAGVSDKV
jgi:nicotinate-nucleotide--dimethylbenzimidazole phosphoribosyltransferase